MSKRTAKHIAENKNIREGNVNKMIIVTIILSWLLFNTWLSLIMCCHDGNMGSNWEDLAFLALAAILNPLIWLGIKALIEVFYFKRKAKKSHKTLDK